MKSARLLITSLVFVLTGASFVHAEAHKPKVVVVSGQVKKPGVVECREGSTILAMINASGGPTALASMKRVRVIRGSAQRIFDLTDDKIMNKTFAMPDDSIEVPKKNILERIAEAL